VEFEARWWNLAGFFLRPGFGHPLDDFRLKEIWKIILGDLKGSQSSECQIQKWICYRRISGGLNKGQQMQIAGELIPLIFDKKTGKIVLRNKGEIYSYSEKMRTMASFERIEMALKVRLAEAILHRIKKEEADHFDYWSLGRIGARHLVYASAGEVVPRTVCASWVEKLLSTPPHAQDGWIFALGQLARKTDQRELNLADELIQRILKVDSEGRLQNLLLEERVLTDAEQEQVLGERLPAGLILEVNR
jgi:hypothetical protein